MSGGNSESVAPNAQRLLWAGFMAILAAGVGFAIRGGIFDNWQAAYGFSSTQLGAIGGAGFSGFCFGIIIGGVLCDKIGYGKLVATAFALHVLSAVVTFGASTPDNAYNMLFWGMFLFALANGCLEAVANPLVATLFPNNRTHYLNILHASWPAGLILGGILGWVLDDRMKLDWKLQLSLYLIPTVIYGIMFLGQSFPKSEASKKGLKLGDMLQDVGILGGLVVCFLLSMFLGDVLKGIPQLGEDNAKYIGYAVGAGLLLAVGFITKFSMGSILLFILFITHALVGAVELGTDGWIQNITGNILSSEQGKILFVFTSALMFALRFCADFIEKKIGVSPVGLLLTCAILACIGLNLTSRIEAFSGALLALTVYGIGKTFFWPTMLAVASDRFPRTGAIAISIMGGIGMMSAGLIGSPGLGYFKDRYSGEALQKASPELYASSKAEKSSKFLIFPDAYGLDGKKLGAAQKTLEDLRKIGGEQKVMDTIRKPDFPRNVLETIRKIGDMGEASLAKLSADEQKLIKPSIKLIESSIKGDVEKPTADSGTSATMTADERKLSEERKVIDLIVSSIKLIEISNKVDRDAPVADSEISETMAAAEQKLTKLIEPSFKSIESSVKLIESSIKGDRDTLVADSVIPATMAAIYLCLLIYFKAIGGYKPVTIESGTSLGTAES